MRFSTVFSATVLSGAALAKDIPVGVGKDGLTFNPASITADVGDVLHFKFWPKNHSVAQASFDKPCAPKNKGFWSGFVPTTDTAKAADLTYTYTVTNASAPIWFYCTQGQHCQNGMVGVINPPASGNKTLDAFTASSKEATDNLSPTATAGQGGNLTTNTSTSDASPSSSTGAASAVQVNSLAFTGVLGMFAYLLF